MSTATTRKRVLFILRRFPWPLQIGSNYRWANIIKRLQDRFIIDLYCHIVPQTAPDDMRRNFDRLFVSTDPAVNGHMAGGSRIGAAATESWNQNEAVSDLSSLLNGGQYQVAVASIGMLHHLPKQQLVPIVGDIIDNDCLSIWRDLSHPQNIPQFFSLCRSFLSAVYYQKAHFQKLATVCYVSKVDSAVSKRITPSIKHEVIPSGIDPAVFRPSGEEPGRHTIVFEGNMSFPPNIDAARYFAAQIFPRVQAAVPGARFYVVGKDPHPDVVALASDDVTITGFVEDIRPWLNKAQVFVSPLRVGAGIKTKVLQAWAMGIPVVATSKSTGGLRVQRDRNIIVRDGEEAFSRAVIQLLQDTERARLIGKAGRRTAEQYYSWDRLASTFGDMLENVMNEKTR